MKPPIAAAAALALLAFASCTNPGPPTGLPAPTAMEQRGMSLLESGHPEEAREVFVQAMSQTQPPFLASVGLSRAAIDLGDWQLCDRALRAAMSAAPGSAEGYDLLGRTLLEAARRRPSTPGGAMNARLASRFFAQARSKEPGIPGLSYHAGLSLLLAGEPGLAVPLLQMALVEPPVMPDALKALVMALRALGQAADVRRLLEPLELSGTLDADLVEALFWARERSPDPPPAAEPPAPDAAPPPPATP